MLSVDSISNGLTTGLGTNKIAKTLERFKDPERDYVSVDQNVWKEMGNPAAAEITDSAKGYESKTDAIIREVKQSFTKKNILGGIIATAIEEFDKKK